MKKIVYVILIILIFGLIGLFIYDHYRMKKYNLLLNNLDNNVMIEFYTRDQKLASEIVNKVKSIYQNYYQLTNRYEEYDELVNLYTIRHNFNNSNSIEIDNDLYQLIQYGIELYDESNGLIDISIGNVTEVWQSYLKTKIAIPSKEELKLVHNQNIDNIVLLEDNKIQNNHVNIDLDSIKNGYVADIISNYLKQQNITNYYINAEDIIVTGDSYQKENYHIALPNPDSETDILMTLKIKNKTIVTKNISDNAFIYQNIHYHSSINPITLYPNNQMKSVTIIADTAKEAEKLANILFSINLEEGKNLLKKYKKIEAIWVTNQDEIIKTDGIQQFE